MSESNFLELFARSLQRKRRVWMEGFYLSTLESEADLELSERDYDFLRNHFNTGYFPHMISSSDNGMLLETGSLAWVPAAPALLDQLDAVLSEPLPQDFVSFYLAYREGLVFTRALSVHLWALDRIYGGFAEMSEPGTRILRFADYWREGFMIVFSLWLNDSREWQVVVMERWEGDENSNRGAVYGPEVPWQDRKESFPFGTGRSFGDWIKWLILTDGLEGPYLPNGVPVFTDSGE